MKSSRVCSDCLDEGNERRPSAIALESEGSQISYAELAVGSAKFAALEGENIPRTALWAEKSPQAVAAVLGILASGRVCIPIDPLNPPERVFRILEDARPGELLASRDLFETARAFAPERLAGARLTKLSENRSPSTEVPRRAERPSPEDLAYLMYTSGSTGRPKGVMISHRAAMTFIDWAREEFELEPSDRVASIAPLHFDLSLFDIFSTLSAGGTICLCPRRILSFGESVLDWIQASRITTLYTTPSLLASIAGAAVSGRLGTVKRILFAGEVMPPRVLEKLMNEAPGARFHNLYGPTETNVCTTYAIDRPFHADGPVPLGYSCPYNQVEVVNEDGSTAGPGVRGEIRVEGPNLMSGYWGAARTSAPYLTGDLGWKDANGLIHFQGRRDAMLKIRGYRVEPAEVEAVISAHPEVRQAASYKTSDASGQETLAAVVVLKKGSTIDKRELRLFCGQRLPSYMIPTEFEFRPALPLNANGKIDRLELARDGNAQARS